MEEFNSLYAQATNNFGQETASIIADQYFTQNGTIDKTFQAALRNFDMTQGNISALASLRSGKSSFGVWDEDTESTINKMASAIHENAGEKGLFEELYQSEDFSDSLSDLQKEFKKTGKISAKSIMEAAESSETLSEWLEASDVGAQGLADVLNTLESGSIDSISEALIRAFGAAGELNNNLAKTYDYIDNFNEERSIQDIGGFYKKRADTVQAGFESGMLLDAPLLQSMEALFGAKRRAEYQQAIYDLTNDNNFTPEYISNEVNRRFAAEIAAMQSIQKRGNLSGMFQYYDNKGTIDMFDYNTKTGQVVAKDLDSEIFKERGWADQNKFIADLQESYGMSEDMARAMASEYAATNGTIAKTWRETGAIKGLGEFEVGIDEKTGLGQTVNASDIRAFYDVYEDVLTGLSSEQLADIFGTDALAIEGFNGKLENAEQLVSLFRTKAQMMGGTVIDLGENFSFASSNLQDLKEAFDENNDKTFDEYFGEGLEKSAVQGSYKNQKTGQYEYESAREGLQEAVNFDQATKKLKDLGATAEQAYTKLDEMREAGDISAFTKTVIDAKNGTQTLNSEMLEFKEYCDNLGLEQNAAAFDQWTQSIDESEKALAATQQQAEIFAKAFVEALTGENGTNVELVFDASGSLQEIKTSIKGLEKIQPSLTFKPEMGEVNTALEGLKQTISATITAAIAAAASGYNNSKGFASGLQAGQYQGIAELGELGPELFIHNGQPYLAGVHGRVKAYISPNDQIFTAAQTKEILRNNPSMQDIPGFSVGYDYHKVAWGSHASASNAKTSKYEPERYHLITRQLKDLQREYDRLDKIKENCYGTNKLEAIQREIDATNELVKGQKELIKEAEDYVKIDAGRLKGLLGAGEFQIDENGNLLNFEELQEKYRRAAEESKDEHAQDVWKALQQYEETLDKLQEANVEMQDLLYQEMELRLEKITTKAELKIDFDEREIKLLDHYIKRIDDNIYHTAEVLALTEEKLGHINQKIEDTKEGIDGLFAELSDSQGNKITKADGSNYTLEDWLALSKEERDLLDINDNFGKQLEEYMDNLLDYIEELEEFKTKGVEEFGEAFSELNDNVRSSIDLFDHYNSLLSSLKNITDLQGVKLSAEMRAVMKDMDTAMFNNTQNNIDVERENYRRLTSQVAELRQKVADAQDETLKREWEEQLKTAEEELRTSEQNMLSLWETGLQQAKDIFNSALEEAATVYEETIAGMYGTTDELQKAWDQQKKNDEFYVKDYEKYYQISKLQRSITKDLDTAARSGNKQNQGLKKLFDDLNAARENGVELSAYDLDIFEKRYEYEKALMELEDARNNKNEVRLQRDANGNWGYVYTSSADDDDLIAKQQAVDDKFYELQKATQERVASLSDDMLQEITGVGHRLQELRSSGASQETIDKYLEQENKYLNNYRNGLAKALADAGMTEEEARLRYGNAGFDILNDFQETLFSAITGGNEGLDDFFARIGVAINSADSEMAQAGTEYTNQMDAINKWFNESGEDLATVIKGFASIINEESDINLLDSKEQIQNAKDTFDEILKIATKFEQKFIEIYQPIIDANEKLVADLLMALDALNREEYEGPDHSHNPGNDISDIVNNAPTINGGNGTNGGSGNGGGSGNQRPLLEEENDNTENPDDIMHESWTYKDDNTHIHTIYYRGKAPVSEPEGHSSVYILVDTDSNGNIIETERKCKKCGHIWKWKKSTSSRISGGGAPNVMEVMATGGYTGAWGPEGRMAMLHEKELVLNKEDTKNFLDATNILRTIDLQTDIFSKGLGGIITPWISDMKSEALEQNVHIEASFPNVQDHNEIELAFDNLINKASQYANRKDMSSMTFQDMYTSKF